jgi:FMN-binding domain
MKISLAALPLFIVACLYLFNTPSVSNVFMNREEALKTAFPGADKIEKTDLFLNDEQVKEIESLSKSKLDSKLYIVYEGKKGDGTLGFAIIDTHSLRTMTETVMFVMNVDGTLRQAEILAFFEPPEYMAGNNWIALFYGKSAQDSLRLGKDIPLITGATITSNFLAQAVRRVLAVFRVGVLNAGTDKGGQE